MCKFYWNILDILLNSSNSNSNSLLYQQRPSVNASLNFAIIGSANGLSYIPRQAITWLNFGWLFIGLLGTNFSVIEAKCIQENLFEYVSLSAC